MNTCSMRIGSAISAIALAGCSPPPEPYDYETPVKRALGNPDTLRFSDVTGHSESACGFVNSKNDTEEFPGRVPFIVVGVGPNAEVTFLGDAGPHASELVAARCTSPTRGIIRSWLTSRAVQAPGRFD